MIDHEVMYHTGRAQHVVVHCAGAKGWEYSEEVEENHIFTFGHGVRPDWMTNDDARRHEDWHRSAH
jgi:hypothetical protein